MRNPLGLAALDPRLQPHKCLKRAAERRSDMARRGHGALSERLRHGFRLEGRGERHPFPRPQRCILNEHRINQLCFMDMIDMHLY